MDTKGYIAIFIKMGLASGIIGVVTYFIYHGMYWLPGVSKIYNLISLLMAVGIWVVVYLVLCYLFGVEEVRDVVGKVGGDIRFKCNWWATLSSSPFFYRDIPEH